MKVRMTSACVDEVREYRIGDVVDLPDVKAERFVKIGLAEKYEEPVKARAAVVETAAVAPVAETATMPAARKRPV